MEKELEILIEKAKEGNQAALEAVILHVKDLVYNLSLKMLLFPEDAKDATQEILIRIITHLGTFRNQSKFETWVYRITTNYLLTLKGKKAKNLEVSFEAYAQLIDTGQASGVGYTKNEGLLNLLEEEVKVSCTHGLLLCLNKTARMVYILGELLEINSLEGARILEITPENYRKQLSRSRVKIRNFLMNKCGLANAKNPCRCQKKIDFLIDSEKINPEKLQFAQHTNRSIDLIGKIQQLEDTVAIYTSVPRIKTPESVVRAIRSTIKKAKF